MFGCVHNVSNSIDPQRLNNVPIKDTKDFRSKVYADLQVNPTFDENDFAFFEGIDFGEEQELDSNVEILRDDQRVKHIRVKGLPSEALAAMNDLDGK